MSCTDTKTCPRCGATLFADMDTCYGCLYDFHTSALEPHDTGPFHPAPLTSPANKSEAAETDYLWVPEFAHDEWFAVPAPPDFLPEQPLPAQIHEPKAVLAQQACSQSAPPDTSGVTSSAQKAAASPDDTTDLSKVNELIGELRLKVVARDTMFVVPLTEKGLVVGRDPHCDIVVSQQSISRRHLRISKTGSAVVLEDLNAKNPISVCGTELRGSTLVGIGTRFVVGSTAFEIVNSKNS